MAEHIRKQDRGHTHTHMGNHTTRDQHASKEYHAMNKEHGCPNGMHGQLNCGGDTADASEEKESEIE